MKRQITQFENGQRKTKTLLSQKKSGQRVWIESTLLQRNIQMVSKHAKRCSTSLVNREKQWDITSHPQGWLWKKKKTTENKKCCQGNGNPHTLLMGNVRWYNYYGKIWQFLKKLNVELQYDPITSYPHPHPRKRKTNIHTETCPWTFIATLFIVAGKWEHPDAPPMINGWARVQWNMPRDFIQPWGVKYRRIHYVKWQAPQSRHYDSIIRNVQNRRIHRGLQQITGCWGPGRRRK